MAEDGNLMQLLSQFMMISGEKDETIALNWLSLSNNNVEQALELYLSSNTDITTNSYQGSFYGSNYNDNMNYGQNYEMKDMDRYKRKVDELVDDEGRRIIPDEVKRQRLIEAPAMMATLPGIVTNRYRTIPAHTLGRPGSHNVFGTGIHRSSTKKEATLNALYEPPFDIMTQEDFLTTREIAKNEKKWLIVNIMDNEDFACHTMNRDVWKDEGLKDLIRAGYIFWQHQRTSSEGMKYVQRYKVAGCPYVAIIDPRTGGVLWEKRGSIKLDAMCEKLTDHMYSNPFPDDPTADPIRSREGSIIDLSKSDSDILDAAGGHSTNEDDDIAKAIALSLQGIPNGVAVASSSSSVTSKASESTNLPQTATSQDKKLTSGHSIADDTSSRNSTGFSVAEVLPMSFPKKLDIEPTQTIKIQFRLPTNKRQMKNFDIHCDILEIAQYVATQLLDDKSEKDMDQFEMYLTYPRVAISKVRQDLLLREDKAIASDNEGKTNTSLFGSTQGLDAGGIVSLWSLGLTKDTVIAVEYI